MKKYKYIILMLSMVLIPRVVFASEGFDVESIIGAIAMEAFVTIHMSFFVLLPISNLISSKKSKEVFWILFIIRIIILLFFDFFITTSICVIDFFNVFIGAFIVVPVWGLIARKNLYSPNTNININNTLNPNNIKVEFDSNNKVILRCQKCNNIVKQDAKFCVNCGAPINNVLTEIPVPKEIVDSSKYDPIFNLDEEEMLEEFIKRECTKANININNNKLLPNDILIRKNAFNIFFSILLFIYISLIFFHFPIFTYIVGLIILIIFFVTTRRFNLIKYLKKEIKSRPGEKISNIVMNVKTNFVEDNKAFRFAYIFLAFLLPMLIFLNPRIMYEESDEGYSVRFYAFGLTNYKTAIIPETYKGKPVISLRGNAFSNMPFLESVTLPNTIKEIRGQAFKNDINLIEVNIPNRLEYLGGGSFYNCRSITNIYLPDTLTYMGGETFYGASSLETIKLSDNLTEIRGDSFEYCKSLRSIKIPDKVTRIGGHAFYDDISLSEVIITENSQLSEIGSSAFRQCYSLYNINIPYNTYVNERAFKESPTTVNRYEYR